MYTLGSVSLLFTLDTLQQHQPTQFWLFPLLFGWPHPAAAVSLDYSTALIWFPSVLLYSTDRVELFRLSSCVGCTLFESREYSQIIVFIIMIYTDSRFNVLCTCYFRWCHLGCWISWRVMMRRIERIKTSDLWWRWNPVEKPTGKLSHSCLLFFWAETLNNNVLRLYVHVYNERESYNGIARAVFHQFTGSK